VRIQAALVDLDDPANPVHCVHQLRRALRQNGEFLRARLLVIPLRLSQKLYRLRERFQSFVNGHPPVIVHNRALGD